MRIVTSDNSLEWNLAGLPPVIWSQLGSCNITAVLPLKLTDAKHCMPLYIAYVHCVCILLHVHITCIA